MYAYIIRRLLWMVPTMLGILLINFLVMRLQGDSFGSVLREQAKGGPGERNARAIADQQLEGALLELAPTGNLLPALWNTRGFVDKSSMVARLERTEASRGVDIAKRQHVVKELWTGGEPYVEPLFAIIADESLQRLHGPASRAVVLAAFTPLDESVREAVGLERFRYLQTRNRARTDLNIRFSNADDTGYVTGPDTDPDYAAKRAKLLAFHETYRQDFAHTSGRAWKALVVETGFVHFMTNLCTGRLYSHKQQQYVFSLIADRWYVTFTLNLLAMIIAWGVAIPLGIRSARIPGTLEDRATTSGLLMLWSLPSFFIGTFLLAVLCTDSATERAPFPSSGLLSSGNTWFSGGRLVLDWLWHAFLPLVVLTYGSFTVLSRYMRGSLLDQLGADYVRTGRAKGASEDRVVYQHALPNSLITLITLGAGLLAELFSSSLFVEKIFSIKGLSLLLYEAAIAKDVPLIMGSTIISVALLLVGILVADILYAVVDPRIRSRYG